MSNPLAHRHPPLRLGPGQQRWIYASFALLWLSGALWLGFHYFLRSEGAFGPEPHALEAWWLRLHGLMVMTSLVALGSVLVHHAGRAWQLRKNRLMGTLLIALCAWLAISGYALYYFSSDASQAWLPLLHWIPGLGLPAMLGLHVGRGKGRQRPMSTELHWGSRRSPQTTEPPVCRGTSASDR